MAAASIATAVKRIGSSVGGAALAAATRSIALLRPAGKPLHPNGLVVSGRLHRQGSDPATGVPWLDKPGEDEVVVRLSRAVGLPTALPDIHGLAMRVLLGDRRGDLLFASTGWGRLGRFLLTFGRRPETRPLTTLLPYRTAVGAVVLGARSDGPGRYELSWAPYAGRWRRFATLELADEPPADQEISFDPVLNQVAGLQQYPAVVRLRAPSYLIARTSRRAR
jgi:hypothetical protein